MNDMTTTPLGDLAKALAAAQAEMRPAAKDSENPHFKSKYADLEAINEAARVLSKHGIAIMCVPSGWNENRIIVRGLLIHTSGQSMEGVLEMPVSQPNNPQAVGSALSYSRRYLIASLANIAAGDDDGNEAAKGATNEPKKAAPKKETPEEPKQSAAAKFADTVIGKMEAMETLAEIVVLLRTLGLFDENEGDWILEENTKLAKLRDTAPDDYARVHAAYNGRTEA
tara:strand:+ start:174 stop:851 length:678 start_codon:yes stop_codon:yes gene_type:complete